MHSSWNGFFTHDRILQLEEIFKSINGEYYPSKEHALRFLELDLSKIDCVIVGMDPYPNYYIKDNKKIPVATGKSFQVGNINNWNDNFKQSSLKNIVKTIYYNETGKIGSWKIVKEQIYNGTFKIKQPREWFNSLEEQGVLFLNIALTVEPGKPGKHLKIWKDFMTDLIKYIDNYNNNTKWLLWGKDSNKALNKVVKAENVISAPHPRLNEFVLTNCFSKVKGKNWLG